MKRIFTIIVIVFISGSCIKDVGFSYPEVPSQVVVNALFTEDEPWKILLTYSKGAEDSTDRYIDNATVTIRSATEEILAEHTGDGVYSSESYPQTGTAYTLTVELPGFRTITATSSVPGKPECEVLPFGTVWSKYMFPNDLLDYDVLPVSVSMGNAGEEFYRFQFKKYNPEFRYLVSPEAIESMRKKSIPEDILAVLDDLYGQYYDNPYFVVQYTRQFANKYSPAELSTFEQIVIREVIKERVEEYDTERFSLLPVFSDCSWIVNIASYTNAVIGENKNEQDAGLFLGDWNLSWAMQNGKKEDKEYWLYIETCSPEFYRYYKTYILQVSQRMNPYAETIKVYSNITNGVGIFAGYNRQMIHFFDY